MVEIIPRWEWRTFARTLHTAIDIAAFPHTRQVKSTEIYLASSASRGNPKIRDEKIDIKTLQQVDDDGLEQWKPVLKASFPLSADQLAEVYRALGLVAPAAAGDRGLDALLQMIDDDQRTWAVFVDKDRHQYDVDGCTVESSEVAFDGEAFRTVAAEHPDPKKVRDTVARLGLLEHENISYVEAIKRIKAGALD